MRNSYFIMFSAGAMLGAAATRGHAQVTIKTAAGDVVQISQKNVVDHLIVGDSLEVEQAQLATTRTQNAASASVPSPRAKRV